MEQQISSDVFWSRNLRDRSMTSCVYIKLFLLIFHLATPITSQIYTGNDFGIGFEAERYARSVEDSDSFEETNELPRFQKKQLQSEILHLLGLEQRPRPPSLRGGHNHSAPQFMLDLYNSLQESLEDDTDQEPRGYNHIYTNGYHRGVLSSMLKMGNYNYTSTEIQAVDDADTIMSLPVLYRRQSIERHGAHRYHFGVASFPRQDILTSAELRVYRDVPPDGNRQDSIYTLKVYRIGSQSDGGNILLDSLLIDGGDVGWLVFDVTEGSQILQTYPGARYSLQLVAENTRGDEMDPDEIGLRGVGESEQLEPFMVAFFKTNENVRREHLNRARRSRSSKKKKNREVQNVQNDPIPENLYSRRPASRKRTNRECRRRSFYISFEQLEWSNWIIAPRGYHAYYCHGECSFPLHSKLNATNHAIVQTLVHLIDPSTAPQACCAPTKTSSIEVLYYDDFNNVIIRKYKQMVVKACGCH